MANGASATGQARTYLEKYSTTPDVLGGEYSDFYRWYRAQEDVVRVMTHIVSSSFIIPKVFLCLTSVGVRPTIAAVEETGHEGQNLRRKGFLLTTCIETSHNFTIQF